jgi:hypothetical protein
MNNDLEWTTKCQVLLVILWERKSQDTKPFNMISYQHNSIGKEKRGEAVV